MTARLTPYRVPVPGCEPCSRGECRLHFETGYERRDLVFELWVPGQIPSGKNQTVLRPGRDGKLRTMPRRRGGRVGSTPFEAWSRPAIEWLRWQKPWLLWKGPLRVEGDYWQGDFLTRDEAGRSDALGHVLERGKLVADDKLCRFHWSYHGLDRDRPGILVTAWSEPETTAVGRRRPESREMALRVYPT